MKQIARLQKKVNEAVAQFEREVSRVLEHKFTAHYSARDRIRLLNLVVWSQKTKLPYSTILRVLLQYWRGRFPSRHVASLGVRPSSLTGAKSWDLISSYIEERFPHNEQVTAWKHSERQRLVALLTDSTEDEAAFTLLNDPVRYEAVYRRQIKRQQKQHTTLQRRMSRRSYRNNPFV